MQNVPWCCYHGRNAESWTLSLSRNLHFKWSVKSKRVFWLQDTIVYRTLFRKRASVWHQASLPSLHLEQQTMAVFSVGNNVAAQDNSSNWWWTKCCPIYLLDRWVIHLTFHSAIVRFSLSSALALMRTWPTTKSTGWSGSSVSQLFSFPMLWSLMLHTWCHVLEWEKMSIFSPFNCSRLFGNIGDQNYSDESKHGAELHLRRGTQGENTWQGQVSVAPLQKQDTFPHRTELLPRQGQQIREERKEIGAHERTSHSNDKSKSPPILTYAEGFHM